MSTSRRACTLGLLAVLTAVAYAQTDPAEAEIKKLEAAAAEASSDLNALRRDLLSLRVRHPGTKAALRAAALLAALPSPLDRLDPANIPPLEKFDAQPKELVAILGEHRGRHGNPVTSVAFSSDGKRLASAGGYLARLWNTSNMRLLHTLRVSGSATSVAISKNGLLVAVGCSNGYLNVFDTPPDKAPIARTPINVASNSIYSVAIHPKNHHVAAACYDGLVRVFDVSEKAVKEVAQATGHKGVVHAVAYAADGKLASAGADRTIRLWEPGMPEYREKSRIETNPVAVTALTISSSGKTMASGLADGTVRLWNLPLGARPKTPRTVFQPSKSSIARLSFSPTATSLAITDSGLAAHVWSAGTLPKLRFKVDGNQAAVSAVAYAPDGKLLATGGADWTVRTYDLAKTKPIERFVPASHLGHVYATAISPDGKSLASGSVDKTVRLWDVAGAVPKSRTTLKGEGVPVYCLAYSPDGKLLAAGGQTTKVRQWDAVSGATRTTIPRPTTWVYQVAYSPDGRTLLSRSGKEVILSDPATGGTNHALDVHKATVHEAAWSPDGKSVATVCGEYERDARGVYLIKDKKYVPLDCTLRVFDAEKGEERAKVTTFEKAPLCVTFAVERPELLVCNGDYQLVPYAVSDDKLTPKDPWKEGYAYALYLKTTADGRYAYGVATGGETLVQWDARTGKRLKTWAVGEAIGGLSLSADGRHLVVGLGTGVVWIMRLEGPTMRKEG